MDPWRRIGSRRLQRCRVFDLDRVEFEIPAGGSSREFYVIDAPDWINVIPLTPDEQVVLVRQYRFGVEGFTLEIPGGMCDPGESPLDAARRELHEETGYRAGELESLGWVHPNPAIQSNRCHTFLASGAHAEGIAQPDPDEEFEVVLEPLSRIPALIADGHITHSLVVAAFQMFGARSR